MAIWSRLLAQQQWLLTAFLVLGVLHQIDARQLDVSRMSFSDIETELQVWYTTTGLLLQLLPEKIWLNDIRNVHLCEISINIDRGQAHQPSAGHPNFSQYYFLAPQLLMRFLQLYIYLDRQVCGLYPLSHQRLLRNLDFLLALCPPNIDPSSLSVMVAFAVGGLLGDTIFHLLPEIFLGEVSPEQARFVLVEPNKNLLLGVAIMIGFVSFVAVDKALRIFSGGEGCHDHSHETKKEFVQKEQDTSSTGSTTGVSLPVTNDDVRSRNVSGVGGTGMAGDTELPILSDEQLMELLADDEPERCKKWISAVLERDPDGYITQVTLWRAYRNQLKDFGKSLISPPEFITKVHDVFNEAQLQNINLQTSHGTEKQYIIKGVKPRLIIDGQSTGRDLLTTNHPSESSNSKAPSTSILTPPSPSIRLSAYLNLIADFTHNITDGLAISSSFYASPTLGATTTVAVFFHEIPHEVGDFALLIQSGFSKWRAMGAQFVTALGALLGTCLGIAVQELGKSGASLADTNGSSAGLLGTGLGWGDLLLPFTAGTFLYVATVAVIPDLMEGGGDRNLEIRKTLKQFLAMACGAGIMLK